MRSSRPYRRHYSIYTEYSRRRWTESASRDSGFVWPSFHQDDKTLTPHHDSYTRASQRLDSWGCVFRRPLCPLPELADNVWFRGFLCPSWFLRHSFLCTNGRFYLSWFSSLRLPLAVPRHSGVGILESRNLWRAFSRLPNMPASDPG